MTKKSVIQNVGLLRRTYGETQVEFAKRLGVTERTIRRWETGEVTNPLAANRVKIQSRIKYRRSKRGMKGIQVIFKDKKTNKSIYTKITDFENAVDMIDNDNYKKRNLVFIGVRVVKI